METSLVFQTLITYGHITGLNIFYILFSNKDSFILLLLARFEKQAPNKAKLKEEIDHLKRVLLKHNCPVVFCHNDMLCKNIVYNKSKGRSYSVQHLPVYKVADLRLFHLYMYIIFHLP